MSKLRFRARPRTIGSGAIRVAPVRLRGILGTIQWLGSSVVRELVRARGTLGFASAGGALGTPNPLGMPQADLVAPIVSVLPDYTAYQALSPRTRSAGWSYVEPRTGLTIVKLTDASVNGSHWHNSYGDGGPYASHPWQSGADWFVTVAGFSDAGGQTWRLFDVKITGTPTVTNGRDLTGGLAPSGDITFMFSNNPATPRIAYVSGSSLRRIDTATMTLANTGFFPRTGLGEGAWAHQDKNDEWFVGLSARNSGGFFYAFNAVTGQYITQPRGIYDELRIDRDGGRCLLGTGANNFGDWNLLTNTVTAGPTTPNHPIAHNASLRQRWAGPNWDLPNPGGIWKLSRSGGTYTRLPNLYTNGFFYQGEAHYSGCWVQPSVGLDEQWFCASGIRGAYTGHWMRIGIGLVKVDGTDVRLVANSYNSVAASGDYWLQVWANQSAGGHLIHFASDMAYSETGGSGRTDLFAAILPRTGGL